MLSMMMKATSLWSSVLRRVSWSISWKIVMDWSLNSRRECEKDRSSERSSLGFCLNRLTLSSYLVIFISEFMGYRVFMGFKITFFDGTENELNHDYTFERRVKILLLYHFTSFIIKFKKYFESRYK